MDEVYIVHNQTVVLWSRGNGHFFLLQDRNQHIPACGPNTAHRVFICASPSPTPNPTPKNGFQREKEREREKGRQGEEYASDSMWPAVPNIFTIWHLRKKCANLCYEHSILRHKEHHAIKPWDLFLDLYPFYLWIYSLTRAKRKCEADLFHPVKDLVWWTLLICNIMQFSPTLSMQNLLSCPLEVRHGHGTSSDQSKVVNITLRLKLLIASTEYASRRSPGWQAWGIWWDGEMVAETKTAVPPADNTQWKCSLSTRETCG